VRGSASLGSIVSVDITAADVYDLYGEIAVAAYIAS
jgi:ribosomal protein S12 methylthiotransferase